MTPVTIDCHYLGAPGVAAAYLARDGASAAFIDNNTAHAVPRLLEALAGEGMAPAQVDYLVVTHVHLDHAGGTSALAAACPNAVVLCHPRAERHLVDPSRLVESARSVYGAATFERLYGRVDPIDRARVRAVADGETVPLGGRTLRFLHTRGHANHHTCVLDETAGDLFAGDSFGLCYPRLQRAGLFVFPSTSPTDFDAAEARASVQRIVATGARRVFPTHFGPLTQPARAAAQLLDYLDRTEEVLIAAVASDREEQELERFCAQRLDRVLDDAVELAGLTLDAADRELLQLDRDLNAQGVAYVARRARAAARRRPA